MVNLIKAFIEGVRSKGCWLVSLSLGPTDMWVTQMTLGVKVFKG